MNNRSNRGNSYRNGNDRPYSDTKNYYYNDGRRSNEEHERSNNSFGSPYDRDLTYYGEHRDDSDRYDAGYDNYPHNSRSNGYYNTGDSDRRDDSNGRNFFQRAGERIRESWHNMMDNDRANSYQSRYEDRDRDEHRDHDYQKHYDSRHHGGLKYGMENDYDYENSNRYYGTTGNGYRRESDRTPSGRNNSSYQNSGPRRNNGYYESDSNQNGYGRNERNSYENDYGMYNGRNSNDNSYNSRNSNYGRNERNSYENDYSTYNGRNRNNDSYSTSPRNTNNDNGYSASGRGTGSDDLFSTGYRTEGNYSRRNRGVRQDELSW
jgi:hypothetical protein